MSFIEHICLYYVHNILSCCISVCSLLPADSRKKDSKIILPFIYPVLDIYT